MSDEDFYRNPRVKIRALRTAGRAFGPDRRYNTEREWSIWEDGERTEFRVVEGADPNPFFTVIDDARRMITSWHIGVSPGNLARLVMRKREAKA